MRYLQQKEDRFFNTTWIMTAVKPKNNHYQSFANASDAYIFLRGKMSQDDVCKIDGHTYDYDGVQKLQNKIS